MVIRHNNSNIKHAFKISGFCAIKGWHAFVCLGL